VLSVQVAAERDDPESAVDYVGYFGTYAVTQSGRSGDRTDGVVEHIMEVAFPSELLTEDPERPFSVVGDGLTLGDGRTWRRLFERVA